MPEIQWTLDSLNKSYQQGYMTGLAGKESSECPYDNDVLVAAWEAGKDDGLLQYDKSMKDRQQMRFA
jgi:ribosome modulation factor